MVIDFYKTQSESNRLEKVLTDKLTINGTFKSEIDIINPIISLRSDEQLLQYNYVHIPDLNRFYFIEKVEITQTAIYTINLSIDVLMSYKEQIKDLRVVIKQSNKNPYFSGLTSSHDVRTEVQKLEFENNFNELGTNILIAINGKDRV